MAVYQTLNVPRRHWRTGEILSADVEPLAYGVSDDEQIDVIHCHEACSLQGLEPILYSVSAFVVLVH